MNTTFAFRWFGDRLGGNTEMHTSGLAGPNNLYMRGVMSLSCSSRSTHVCRPCEPGRRLGIWNLLTCMGCLPSLTVSTAFFFSFFFFSLGHEHPARSGCSTYKTRGSVSSKKKQKDSIVISLKSRKKMFSGLCIESTDC